MTPKTRLAALAVAVFLFAAIAAPPASAAPDDACSLLTQAQVTSVVGVAVGAGEHVMPTYLKTCTWTATGAAQGIKYVTLSLQAANSFGAAKNMMEQMQAMQTAKGKNANQLTNSSASGIGDDAFYTSMGSKYTGLLVKKGDVAFKVAIYGEMPTEKTKALEKSLALQVLSKL
jgi:hypothetical protein